MNNDELATRRAQAIAGFEGQPYENVRLERYFRLKNRSVDKTAR